MKKVLISLSLLCASFSAFSMDHTGGGSAATAPQQQKIIVTSDGKRIPISGTIFEELRSGLFADFLCLHPKESLLATRFQDRERGLLTAADTQKLWHDLAAEWDKLTLTEDNDFPLDIIDAHTLETLFTLAHHPEEFQRIWARCSIAQQIQLYDAADFLVLHSPLRTAIINATARIIPAIGQLSKDKFLTLLPQLRSMVTHCLPARCALAHQLAFNGIQPHSTQLPIAERVLSFHIAPDGTLAYTTGEIGNHQLYLYNLITETSTRIRDHVWLFTLASDGTLAYTTDETDNHRLYLYNQTTETSTRIRDNVLEHTFAPDGTLAYKTFVTDNYQLYLYNQTTRTSTLIRDNVLEHTFAPDGTLAYKTFVTDNYQLYLYNQTTGTSTPLIREHVWDFYFSPDGTLAYTTFDEQLYLYNPTTGTSTRIRDRVAHFNFAPDGTLAYITDNTDNHRLYLYNPTTGTSTLIRDHVWNLTFAPDGTLAYITDETDNRRLYLYNPTTETSTQIRDNVYSSTFAPDGTLYLLADGHLLHYNFTYELDAVQQLILLFVLSHEHTEYPCLFTPQEIDDLQEGLYYSKKTGIAAQKTGTTMAQLLSRSPGAIAQSYLPPTSVDVTQLDNPTPALANTLRNHLLKRIPPLPEEARRPTAEQLRTSSGLRNSLLDMPPVLLAHVHIADAPAAAGAGAGPEHP